MPLVPEFYGGAYGSETLTVTNAVKSLTASVYNPSAGFKPRAMLITVHAQPIRYVFDGSTPVAATTGHLAAAGESIFVAGNQNIEKFRAIRDQASDASIAVTYFG